MPYHTKKPPLWTTKRFLKEQIHELEQQLAQAQRDVIRLRADRAVAQEQAKQWERAAVEWMAKYEETPEAEQTATLVDDAYRRGKNWQRKAFQAWLLTSAAATTWDDAA